MSIFTTGIRLLPGTDVVFKMAKSLGNQIPLTSTPDDMYLKGLSVPDIAMGKFFRLATRWTPDKVTDVEAGLKAGAHPRDVKMTLAWEVTSSFYGDVAADAAQEHFRTVFQKGGTPEEMPVVKLEGSPKLVELLVNSNLVKSKNEARRLIEQGGVKVDGQTVSDVNALAAEGVLQVGKRTFAKVTR
ncbi:MAG: S4 domain-containing protein [Chloroflexota bacterium]